MWREWGTIDKCKCNDVKYIFIVATAQQSLDITDLQRVLNLLRDAHFNGDWEGLGLQLGLYQHPTLSNLQHTYGRGAALRECLALWLQRGDGVDKNGGANYVSLANAVERLGQRAAADDIRSMLTYNNCISRLILYL